MVRPWINVCVINRDKNTIKANIGEREREREREREHNVKTLPSLNKISET